MKVIHFTVTEIKWGWCLPCKNKRRTEAVVRIWEQRDGGWRQGQIRHERHVQKSVSISAF